MTHAEKKTPSFHWAFELHQKLSRAGKGRGGRSSQVKSDLRAPTRSSVWLMTQTP